MRFKAGPDEGLEIKQALVATGVILLVVLGLILLYAALETYLPATASVVDGKVTAVSDPFVLARSLILKLTGVLVGVVALFWGLLGINHWVPNDGLKKITEDSLSSAIFFGAIAISLMYVWCFG